MYKLCRYVGLALACACAGTAMAQSYPNKPIRLIVGFAPGVLAFAWLTDRAFVLRWRTLAGSAAILAAGLLQYTFVLVRSGQPDAYVESRATTFGELVNVMLGQQFRDRLFAFEGGEVWARMVALARNVAWPELTLAGLCLAGVGVVWLMRRGRAEAALLLSGAIAVFTDQGYEIHTDLAHIDLARGIATGPHRVTGQGPQGTFVADRFRIEKLTDPCARGKKQGVEHKSKSHRQGGAAAIVCPVRVANAPAQKIKPIIYLMGNVHMQIYPGALKKKK